MLNNSKSSQAEVKSHRLLVKFFWSKNGIAKVEWECDIKTLRFNLQNKILAKKLGPELSFKHCILKKPQTSLFVEKYRGLQFYFFLLMKQGLIHLQKKLQNKIDHLSHLSVKKPSIWAI